jgi:hypothetical protein
LILDAFRSNSHQAFKPEHPALSETSQRTEVADKSEKKQ